MSAPRETNPDEQLAESSNELHQRILKLLKLLADDKRLQIMLHIGRAGELHVSHLCDCLAQSQPAVSHHLGLMRDAGLLKKRRDGKHNYYSIRPDLFHDGLDALFGLLGRSGEHSLRFENVVVERADGGE